MALVPTPLPKTLGTLRIAYLATADARGHLMRSHLLTKALRANGATVRVLTTSEAGQQFLAGFGIDAELLSSHYAVQFDTQQNMQRGATDANVAHYMFRPSRMLRDIVRLAAVLRGHDLIINDSFHPALLFMGCLPGWRRKVVHVYGASLRRALETNFEGRLPVWLARLFSRLVALQIDASRARFVHDFSYAERPQRSGNCVRLPTPVAVVEAPAAPAGANDIRQAAVYLNPHFSDPLLAEALERGLSDAGLQAHLVGEGYRSRPRWLAQDTAWVEQAAASDIIVSAPGMAALSIALVYRRPILLVLTDQPEQRRNAERAVELGLCHRTIVWRSDPQAFCAEVQAACLALCGGIPVDEPGTRGHAVAAARLQAWVDAIAELIS